MPLHTPTDWLSLCNEDNKLQPSLRRHIYRVSNYVVKIDLDATEPDAYGDRNDPRTTRLLSENAKVATQFVAATTTIPVPTFVEDGYIESHGMKRYFSVWKYIEGNSLESKWDLLTMETKERIMAQLHEYTKQLRQIHNPFAGEFEVGTFCSTHELLNDPGIPSKRESFWHNNGPFKTVEGYKQKIQELYEWIPVFDDNTKPVLDHMDWFMCNVLIDEEGKNVVGLLDWEKAGFIPAPRENFLAGATSEVMDRYYPWLTLFDTRASKGRVDSEGLM